jgi:flavin-dependent dehydrogenase
VSVASNPDILIVGAGLAGAAAAEMLAARFQG